MHRIVVLLPDPFGPRKPVTHPGCTSTLINILAGLARLDAGSVAVLGHDVVKDYRQARRALGVVPQELVFDPFFSVREVLRLQAGYFGLGRENDAWIEELLHGAHADRQGRSQHALPVRRHEAARAGGAGAGAPAAGGGAGRADRGRGRGAAPVALFALIARYRTAQDTIRDAEEMLAAGDEEGRVFLNEAQAEIDMIVPELREAMVETDPNDDRDVILEIRAAAGGDEAGLFAKDLFDVYTKYAAQRGFRTELMGSNPSESGGFKEVSLAVKGQGAFSVFKHEGGVHRVQRVPATESQGRIHTSTATVAVMPEVEDVEVAVEKSDLKIDVYRSTGPGGQSVNTTDSAVRITHLPTGIVVAIQDEKSQLQNRDKAMRVLRARLYERAMEEQMAQLSADRRAQQGGGDRSEKVRTYNYPQNRVTDHRVNVNAQLREQVLEGKLHSLTEALQADERRRRLADMTESEA